MLAHELYNELRKYGVDVFSVITDAFLFRSSDLVKVHELLEFDNGFGTWRTSQDNNIILPSHTLQQKENHAIII